MYRALRAAHLLTHYCHCQEGTKRERGGERRRVFFFQGNHKEQDSQQTTFSFPDITGHIKGIICK